MNLPGAPLLRRDLEMLARAAISQELAEQANLRRVDSMTGAELVGRVKSDGAVASGDFSGIFIPYYVPGKDEIRAYRLRRDFPDLVESKGGRFKEKAKYLSPPDRGNSLYYVPGTDPDWLLDARLPIVVTEGEKKTLALWGLAWHELGEVSEQPRFLPIGLSGVWNWGGTIAKTVGPEGDRRDVKGLIPDFQKLLLKGRQVTIVFDVDVRTNQSVQAARAIFAKELRERGARVLTLDLPEELNVSGVDDLLAKWGPVRVGKLLDEAQPAGTPSTPLPRKREFRQVAEGRYILDVPEQALSFEVDRLRRERQELWGELTVRCELPGVRSIDGDLSIGDFNFSAVRSRSERAKILIERSNVRDVDWLTLLEEFCQRVLRADRAGNPAIDLRTAPMPEPDDTLKMDGFVFPRRHPTIIFGDGGTAKSYTSFYLGGRLAVQGLSIAFFDWELEVPDQRQRLEFLFGANKPRIIYIRCERPLVYEVDRLQRIVTAENIDFAIYDSIAYACDGPPESAEVAQRYFRAVRQIGVGSIHIAHVTKAESEHSDKKPFGSTFWHNSARSTWFAKTPEERPNPTSMTVGFFNRKSNMGRLQSPVGYRIQFLEEQTSYERISVADDFVLAENLSTRQRMEHLLKRQTLTPAMIADELGEKVSSVERLIRRYKDNFVVLEGGKIGLCYKGRVA